MVTAMAKLIEFCVPEKSRKQSGKWIPSGAEREDHFVPRTNKKSA
jgi:hypothetical protein